MEPNIVQSRPNQFSEAELLDLASYVCNLSPENIFLIGGGLILPEIVGYKRLRFRSCDLDFIATEDGIDDALEKHEFESAAFYGFNEVDGYATYMRDVFIALSTLNLRGYEVPQSFEVRKHETSQGVVYSIPHELNLAMKIRRGVSKGHIYGKDGLDFASTVTGLHLDDKTLDVQEMCGYMNAGVCESCQLTSNLKCTDLLKMHGTHNISKDYRQLVGDTADKITEEMEAYCKKN